VNAVASAVFQQFEIDYAMGPAHALARSELGVTPIIRMFGVTEAGGSSNFCELFDWTQ
jgi:hypothetical protein